MAKNNTTTETEEQTQVQAPAGRQLKYEYPDWAKTPDDRQKFRRQMRALARKEAASSEAASNPEKASKSMKGKRLLAQTQPACDRCGEPGDRVMERVIPEGAIADEEGTMPTLIVHRNSCHLPTDQVIEVLKIPVTA